MNFPGLDPSWTNLHRTAHRLRLLRTWTLEQCRAAVARGERVLVVASTALGDSILATPLVETLARRLGPGRVSLLVREPYAELYEDDPRLHRLFTVRGKFRWDRLRPELKAEPHRIALLANFTEPDLIPLLHHAGVRGFLRYRTRWTRFPDWMANRDMLRPPGHPEYATGHAIENNLAMAGALGLEPATHGLSLPHLFLPGAASVRRVLIHPGASRASKRWPAERWAAVADAVVERLGCTVAITGGKTEIPLAWDIAHQMKGPAEILAGRLSLTNIAQLQATSLAFLSGDTGPYHLAVAVGCPTVTLFAPTDRGSSVEACGPHQADPLRHRALQTAALGEPIDRIPLDRVVAETLDLLAVRA